MSKALLHRTLRLHLRRQARPSGLPLLGLGYVDVPVLTLCQPEPVPYVVAFFRVRCKIRHFEYKFSRFCVILIHNFWVLMQNS